MSATIPHSFNRLGHETSPYLRQHKDNPVHWWPWGEAAFTAARESNRPVLLSVGYAACHWCHVMAHESFEDPVLAAQMNRDFVCIKVDREERPDVDAIYMRALQLMGEAGGWPLTMFLTPDRKPFWGGTYFPPRAKYGRPAFGEVLAQIARVWREAGDMVAEQSAALAAALAAPARERGPGGLSMALLDDAAAQLLDHVDAEHGGLQGAPKFPMPFVWGFMWRAHWRSGRADFRRAVTTTLTRLCNGGIYDHLGGGFARYSTDARWLVPHFEKMLYDNALLIELLTLVWQDTRDPLYAARVEETVAWLEREMIADNGAFAAALDADSEGEEGKFYVWTEAEIDALLDAEAPLFKAAYDVTSGGNWDGRVVLNRNAAEAPLSAADEERLASARAALFAARRRRVPPARDDKALADWNGLAIAALARAGFAFGRPEWIARARQAFSAVTATMTWRDAAGRARLAHSWCAGRRQDIDVLDDYANMAAAALTLFEITGERGFLDQAQAWVGTADALFWDAAGGGYFFTPADATDVIVRTRTPADSAVPSGNGTLALTLARLYHLTGDDDHRLTAERIVQAFAAEAIASFPHAVQVLVAHDMLCNAVQVVVVGDQPQDLAAAVAASGEPNLILQRVADGRALPATHPAHGKQALGGRATAYVCRGPVCAAPVTDAAALAALLQRPRPPAGE